MASNLPPTATPRAPHQPSPLSQPPSVPNQNAGPHLLSLKVMRASAPALAVSEKPYYDDYDSPEGLIKAVGSGIEDGSTHDLLSNRWEASSSSPADNFPISNLLALPNSFGTLYLGETFRTYLCVRNESAGTVREPSLRVEMQVGAADPQQPGSTDGVRWHQLAHLILPSPSRYTPEPDADAEFGNGVGKPVWELTSGQPLETSLGYDIKDVGPHVLVCTVGYKAPMPQEGGEVVWAERSFRKFYKFSVDRSPISVRTKVHQPRHASSLFHPDEKIRKRVELEVQVQNVTGNGASLVFQGLKLKPSHGWKWESVDRPSLNTHTDEEGNKTGERDMWICRGSSEVLADGDVRQYLFILVPSSSLSLSEEVMKAGIDMGTSPEGHIIRGDALGHLDIRWRMSLGEPGRLQTSQLVRRRVVLPPVSPSVSSSPSIAKELNPQLSTQLSLLPRTLKALQSVRVGEEVELGVKIEVSDVSALLLPPREDPQEDKETSSGDDDDTPLSEISPRSRRSTTVTHEEGESITIRRTLRLALQHCSISAPPPPPPSQAPLGTHDSASHDAGGPSTPRKTPLHSRTSTPTQNIAAGLNRSRLQANLTNLVRNSSLSLRPRGSVDASRSESEEASPIGTSRGGTPIPPAVPPKSSLAAAAIINEKSNPISERDLSPEVGEAPKLPPPTLSWPRITELYTLYSETHSQALTRSANPHHAPTIPANFLPTEQTPLENSLIILPDIQLDIHAWRGGNGRLYRSTQSSLVDKSVETRLTVWIPQEKVADVVRFGALRVILLAYSDVCMGSVEDRSCMTVIDEIPVFAETLLIPY